MDTEIAFIIPAIVDQKFRKAQLFCNSRFLSDLVGKIVRRFQLKIKNIFYKNSFYKNRIISLKSGNNKKNLRIMLIVLIAAAWISRELKKLGSDVQVLKLNGQNSHQEKERITNLFKDG